MKKLVLVVVLLVVIQMVFGAAPAKVATHQTLYTDEIKSKSSENVNIKANTFVIEKSTGTDDAIVTAKVKEFIIESSQPGLTLKYSSTNSADIYVDSAKKKLFLGAGSTVNGITLYSGESSCTLLSLTDANCKANEIELIAKKVNISDDLVVQNEVFAKNYKKCTTTSGVVSCTDFGAENEIWARDLTKTEVTLKNTADKVVIGVVTNPSEKLEVAGKICGLVNNMRKCLGDAGTSPNGWVDTGPSIILETKEDNVGIGTTTPTSKLEVVGSANISDGLNVSNGLAVESGNVGIGTTTPGEKLEVIGNVKATNFIVTDNTLITCNGAEKKLIVDSVTNKLSCATIIETDPEVGILTDTKWCKATGTAPNIKIDCTSDTTAGSDVRIGVLQAAKWCKTSGDEPNIKIDCNLDLPDASATNELPLAGTGISVTAPSTVNLKPAAASEIGGVKAATCPSGKVAAGVDNQGAIICIEEFDLKVGTITPTKWCQAIDVSGVTKIVCTSDTTTGSDPRISTLAPDGRICFTGSDGKIVCNEKTFVWDNLLNVLEIDGVVNATGDINTTGKICTGNKCLGELQDGISSLIKVTQLGVRDTNCPNGGNKIEVGMDDGLPSGTAKNSELETGEVDQTSYICNSASGASGYNSLIEVSSEPVGSNCANSGKKITIGLDNGDNSGTAGNNILESGEIDKTEFICNGNDGSLSIAGGDKQLLYKDGSTTAGAEVYYDKVNKRVGIGTTTAEFLLHLKQSPGASTDGPYIAFERVEGATVQGKYVVGIGQTDNDFLIQSIRTGSLPLIRIHENTGDVEISSVNRRSDLLVRKNVRAQKYCNEEGTDCKSLTELTSAQTGPWKKDTDPTKVILSSVTDIVGIGKVPGTDVKLDVEGNIKATGSIIGATVCTVAGKCVGDLGTVATDNDWQIDGGNKYVYNTVDNIGIGVNNPQRKLVVGIDTTNTGSSTAVALYNKDINNDRDTVLSFRTDTTGIGAEEFKEVAAMRSRVVTHDAQGAEADLSFFTMAGGTLKQRLSIIPSGNVGIGVAQDVVPSEKLVVEGNINATKFCSSKDGGTQNCKSIEELSGLSAVATGPWTRDSANNEVELTNIGDKVGIGTTTPTSKLEVVGSANISDGLNVSNGLAVESGNVGIGTKTPGEKLEVTGNIKATGTICSIVNGITKCVGDPGTASSGPWTKEGTDKVVLSTLTDSVVIGTSPSTGLKLDVKGDIKSTGKVCDGAGICLGDLSTAGSISLVRNGNAELYSNTNFPDLTYYQGDCITGQECFRRIGANFENNDKTKPIAGTVLSSDLIPVTIVETYTLTGFFKSFNDASNPINSIIYLGIAEYDKNKDVIKRQMVDFNENSLTELSSALTNGQTGVTLRSGANWNNFPTDKTHDYQRHLRYIGLWNEPYNSLEYDGKYTRTVVEYDTVTINQDGTSSLTFRKPLDNNGNWEQNPFIDKDGKWIGGTIPSGTKAANMIGGGTYNYVAASGKPITKDWVQHTGSISGTRFGNERTDAKFRYGVEYIRILILPNYPQGKVRPNPLPSPLPTSASDSTSAWTDADEAYYTRTGSGPLDIFGANNDDLLLDGIELYKQPKLVIAEKVGVGTLIPQEKLSVASVNVEGQENSLVVAQIDSTVVGGLYHYRKSTVQGDSGLAFKTFDGGDGPGLTTKVVIDEKGNVGIGKVPSTDVKLDVEGNIKATGSIIGATVCTIAGKCVGDLGTAATDNDWQIDVANKYVYNTVDNIGIGVNNPQRKLVVGIDTTNAGSSTAVALYNKDRNNDRDTVLSFRTDTTGIGAEEFKEVAAMRSRVVTHDAQGAQADLSFFTMAGGTLNQRLSINPSGNVGIGTTDPSGLQVDIPVLETTRGVSNVRMGTTPDSARIIFEKVATAQDQRVGQWEIDSVGDRMRFYQPSSEKMTILSTGNVGIGTATPSEKLEVAGNIKTNAIKFGDGTSLTTASTPSPSFQRDSSLFTDLVSYYKLDGFGTIEKDSVGTRDGAVTGALDRVTGKRGTARFFDGNLASNPINTDAITIADDNAFDFASDFTISLWVKIPTVLATSSENPILEKWSGTGAFPLSIRVSNQAPNVGKIIGSRSDRSNTPTVISQNVLNDDKFHHIIFMKAGASLKLIVDGGNPVIIPDTATGITSNQDSLIFGKRGDNTLFFKGTIDEVGLWKRALDVTEQLELYNSGTGKTLDAGSDLWQSNGNNIYNANAGRVGIGTGSRSPVAVLDVVTGGVSANAGFGTNEWFSFGAYFAGFDSTTDNGRIFGYYGNGLAAPRIVLEDYDDPSRIEFQQTGRTTQANSAEWTATGTEANPDHKVWIGMSKGLSSDLSIMGGNVGINTTAPKAMLTIEQNFKGDRDILVVDNPNSETGTNGVTTGIRLDNANNQMARLFSKRDNNEFVIQNLQTVKDAGITFKSGSSNVMRIKSNGNVGIGANNPQSVLHINFTGTGSTSGNEVLRLEGDYNGAGSGPMIRFTNQHDAGTNPNAGEYNLAGIGAVDENSGWGGKLIFQTAPSMNDPGATAVSGGQNLLPRMVIDRLGRVGIGLTNPTTPLDVSGTIKSSGEVIATGGLKTSAGADIAEYFPVIGIVEPGDVVIIDTSKEEQLKISEKAYDPLVAGVVSTDPGITLGKHGLPIALAGRVPINVIGEVNIGDLLTTSNTRGRAMRCDDKSKCVGAIIGKAISKNNNGKVVAIVSLQ